MPARLYGKTGKMTENPNTRPIVVGVDGSPSSISALLKASQLSRVLDLPMEAVTTYPAAADPSYYFYPIEKSSPEQDAKKTLDTAIASAFGKGPLPAFERVLLEGPPARVLIDRSQEASMLVLGSRGHGGFAGLLLGSVSTACAAHAKCPVLIMHSEAETESATP